MDRGPLFYLVIIFLLILAACVYAFSPLYALFIVLGIFVFFASFKNTDLGLIIIIAAMIFSPEIQVAKVPNRAVAIRAEDIFLIVVFTSWIVRMAINKELKLIQSTPLNIPIFIFIGFSLISSIKGALLGDVGFFKSAFFSLKYIEYFLLFFMVYNHIRERSQIKIYFGAFVVVFILANIYGYSQIGTGLISTPFEGTPGEPATYGGYVIIVGFVILACAWHIKKIPLRLALFGTFLFSIPPFLYSLSRASYTAMIPAFLAFFTWTRKNKFLLILLLTVAIVMSVLFMPDFVKGRLAQTFVGEEKWVAGQYWQLEPSASARIERWNKLLLEKWPKKPLLGYGPGSLFADGQYFTFIAENGFIGLFTFVWIIMTIFKVCFDNLKILGEDDFAQGLTIGFMSGLVGLLVHGLTANTFIIVRIMEPFWFLAAMVLALPKTKGINVT